MNVSAPDDDDPAALARRVAAHMRARDRGSALLDMSLDEVGPGRAVLSMTVRPDMLNGFGVCHGGYIFTLADSACAFASNSANRAMVLQSGDAVYLEPAREGDRLAAAAETAAGRGRTGVVDAVVSRADGTRIALFRGIVRAVGGAVLPEDGAGPAEG